MGCKRETAADSETIRSYFNEMEECQAHIKITSDLGQSVLEYEIDYTYQRDGNDSFTITVPQELSGISGTIAGNGEDGCSLQYNGMELDDAMPQCTGVTPADCLFWLLSDLRSREPAQQWTERASGENLIALRYESEDKDDQIIKNVWLSENLQLVYAELYVNNNRLLTVQVMSYQ